MAVSEGRGPRAGEAAGAVEDRAARGTLRQAASGFWSVIGIMFAVTMGLGLLAISRTDDRQESAVSAGPATEAAEPTEVTIPRTTIEQWIERAAGEAERRTTVEAVAPNLDEAFAPVYAAIAEYADFHYSVIGEYTELAEAALLHRVSRSLEERLFGRMDQRLEKVSDGLEQQFAATYKAAIAEQLRESIPEGMEGFPLSKATEIALNDALHRAATGKPIADRSTDAGARQAIWDHSGSDTRCQRNSRVGRWREVIGRVVIASSGRSELQHRLRTCPTPMLKVALDASLLSDSTLDGR